MPSLLNRCQCPPGKYFGDLGEGVAVHFLGCDEDLILLRRPRILYPRRHAQPAHPFRSAFALELSFALREPI